MTKQTIETTTKPIADRLEALATLENAKAYQRTCEKFTFCIDLLEISAHWDRADYWVNALEDRFDKLLERNVVWHQRNVANAIGLRCFVYFNLHRKTYSLKALEGPLKGRVIGHADTLELTDCTFKVSEAGRRRVIRDKRKNVHAGVVGTVKAIGDIMPWRACEAMLEHAKTIYGNSHPVLTEITYNPYKYRTFVQRSTEQPVTAARYVLLDADSRKVGADLRTKENGRLESGFCQWTGLWA